MSISSSLRLHNLYYNLGCVLHQQGQLAAAAKSYYRALDLQHSALDAGWSEQKAKRLRTVKRAKQANSLIAQLDQLKVYSNLGCILVEQERWQEAIAVYQRAIQLQPEQAVLHSNLGRVLFRHSPLEAIAAYRKAIQLQPDFGLAHYNLGLALQHQNQHQAALECFQQTLRLEPDRVSLHSDCAASWMALGDFEQMLNSLRRAVFPYADLLDAYSRETVPATDHLSLAKASCGQFLQRLLQEASSLELIQALAQTYWHWANVLTTYGGNQQYRRAETYYQTALRLQPQNLDLMLDLADCLVQQGRLNAAVLLYRTILIRHPDQSQIYIRLGAVLEQQQQFDSAIDCYQTALKLNPQTAVSINSTPLAPVTSRYWALTQDWLRDRQLADCYSAIDINLDTNLEIQQPEVKHLSKERLPLERLSGEHLTLEQATQTSGSQAACAGLNCERCLKQIWNWFNPLHLGKGLYHCPTQATIPVTPYPLFVALIPQGQAWIVPQQNAWMVCNAVAVLGENGVLSDLSRAYPAQLPGCDQSHLQFDVFLAQTPPQLKTIAGRVAVLSNLSGNTYFHWMVDVLPRLELLRQQMDLKQIDWFFVNSIQHPFQVETLKMLGISPERVIASDQHPYIQATELVAPSFSGHFGWLEPWALDFLRRSFLDPILDNIFFDTISDCPELNKLEHYANLPQRIYISRSDANHRRVLNEAEVLERLQAFGFVAVELEALSFQAQVALFAHAQVIVAPHGSGLTNLVFCSPGTTVVELVSPHYMRHYYWVISRLLSLNHYFLAGEILPCYLIRELMYQNPLLEDIWVNLDALTAMLERLNLAVSDSRYNSALVPLSQPS